LILNFFLIHLLNFDFPTPAASDPSELLVKTVFDQAHLSPLPLISSPIYWAYDHALRLFPLPDVCVLADRTDQYEWEYEGCLAVNPGPFAADLAFVVYQPATRTTQYSRVPPEEREDEAYIASGASSAPGAGSRGGSSKRRARRARGSADSGGAASDADADADAGADADPEASGDAAIDSDDDEELDPIDVVASSKAQRRKQPAGGANPRGGKRARVRAGLNELKFARQSKISFGAAPEGRVDPFASVVGDCRFC
jgi:hypothetical protein